MRLALVPLAIVAGVAAPSVAFACGGFFCNNAQPVNQTAETVVFFVEGDEIEAHVEVAYEGPAESFAWIVPTPSRPEVGVSTAAAMQRIESMLQPVRAVTTTVLGDCLEEDWLGGEDAGAGSDTGWSDATSDAGGEDAGAPVTVVERTEVGPYDVAVLQATAVEPLFEWLEANDYDVPGGIMPFVEPYVLMDDDMHFVAFRLTKDRDTGDIQPITLRYVGEQPVVPIQLTAIASAPDLGLRVIIVGDDRAVPENYLHVVLNEHRLDWMRGAADYNVVVAAAVDEAGGQAFVTEASVPASRFDEQFWSVANERDLEAIRHEANGWLWWTRMQRLLLAAGVTPDASLVELLNVILPIPEALDRTPPNDLAFYNCPTCYTSEPSPGFSAEDATDAMHARYFEPLARLQQLFDLGDQVTSLYTTLSPIDMTRDPCFAFNPDLPDVNPVQRATATIDCRYGTYLADAPTWLQIHGQDLYVGAWNERAGGAFRADFGAMRVSMPAALRIEETGASGPPVLVSSQWDEIERILRAWNDANDPGPVPDPDDRPDADAGASDDTGYSVDVGWDDASCDPGPNDVWGSRPDSDDLEDAGGADDEAPSNEASNVDDERGCSVAGGTRPPWFVALVGIALVARRRRIRAGYTS